MLNNSSRGIITWPWAPLVPSPYLGGKPILCALLWLAAEVLLLEGYHHSTFILEAQQATGWIEGCWRVGNFRNSDELWAAPRGEFCSTHGSVFSPFLLTLLEIATFGILGYYNNCSTAFTGKGLPGSTGRGLKEELAVAGMSWKGSFPPKLYKLCTVDQTLEELRALPRQLRPLCL